VGQLSSRHLRDECGGLELINEEEEEEMNEEEQEEMNLELLKEEEKKDAPPSIWNLLNNIPKFRMVQEISSSNNHTSDHTAANVEKGIFKLVKNPLSSFGRRSVERESSFLSLFMNGGDLFGFANEQDVQSAVEKFIEDILKGLGWWGNTVKLVRQQAMVGSTKADIWIVLMSYGRPIGVIEVKVPGKKDKMHDPHVCDQIFDYMVQLRASYGQCELFGIVTTLKDWRIFWFPDTNPTAASTALPSPNPDSRALAAQFPIGEELVSSRTLIGSRVYLIHEKYFCLVIASVLLKCKHSNYRPLPLFSMERVYHTFTPDSYLWDTFKRKEIDGEIEISFLLPDFATKSMKVLRHFHRGADGNVLLCINSSMRMCVLKFHHEDVSCLKELEVWQKVYERNVWLYTTISNRTALVLPFVFHCITRFHEEGDGKIVGFNFDLLQWCKEGKYVVMDDSSSLLGNLKSRLIDAYMRTQWSPKDVASIAIDNFADKGYCHLDLEWRHVALRPNADAFDRDEITLTPILIDLVQVETLDTVTARDKMHIELNRLCENCSFSNYL
jgi:hypothetical protein